MKNKQKLTIEFVEKKCNIKLTYPNQLIQGRYNNEKNKEIVSFGCSDIWDEEGTWVHRDCFSRRCKKCAYYPIVEKYNKKHNIPSGVETDFVKANNIFNLFKKKDNDEK